MKGTIVAIILAFLLAGGALAGSWFLYEQYQMELAAREDLESQMVQLEERAATQENQINDLQEENARLKNFEDKNTAQKEQIDSLQKELTAAQKERDGLKAEVKKLEEEKKAFANRPPQVVPRVPAPAAPAAPSGSLLPAPSPASTNVAAAPLPSPPPSGNQKQVLSLNRKFNFAVINMGSKDGVKIGDTLKIEQGGKPVATVQVEKLYENFSACTILEELKPSAIKEGDLVQVA